MNEKEDVLLEESYYKKTRSKFFCPKDGMEDPLAEIPYLIFLVL